MQQASQCKHPTCGSTCRRPSKPKPIRKQIARFSKKRAKAERSYTVLRKEFLETHPECEAKLKVCTVEATQVHHKKGRIGDDLLDERHWLACCGACHAWIELNPKSAKELELSESRLTLHPMSK